MEATYQQIQETIYAIGTARQMNGEEWQQVCSWLGSRKLPQRSHKEARRKASRASDFLGKHAGRKN